ncbi:hypothetical protein PNEG_02396 [Pneumocystis murina B123]|uniref:Uncharacterized protein n=1 Tax=Pneumocystis murina (strain B123) TaxID=1069680 RepID=M7NLB0_PNEMU|nr:hypothetical protein PNEG_02396 [Pneumocystis murina B123]EMR09453.1 hypothetical protein PNEG_02396 [Pneumocystis murina B123]
MKKTLASYLIVCSSSFFLGILFISWIVDHFTFWMNPVTDQALLNAETYYLLLYQAPSIHKILLHILICFGFFAHVMKLYGGNKSNLLFDSGSLVLYIAGIIIYNVYLIQGILFYYYNAFYLDYLIIGLETIFQRTYISFNRIDTLRILAASHVVLALILIGILVLQSSQFCAEQTVIHSETLSKRPKKHLQSSRRLLY